MLGGWVVPLVWLTFPVLTCSAGKTAINTGQYLRAAATVDIWRDKVGAKVGGVGSIIECAGICLSLSDQGCSGFSLDDQEDCFLLYLLSVLPIAVDPGSTTASTMYFQSGLLANSYKEISHFPGMMLSPHLVETAPAEVEIICKIKCHLETDFECSLFVYDEVAGQCSHGHFEANAAGPNVEGTVYILADIDLSAQDLFHPMSETHIYPSNLYASQANMTEDQCKSMCLLSPDCDLAAFDQAATHCQIGRLESGNPGEGWQPLPNSSAVSLRKRGQPGPIIDPSAFFDAVTNLDSLFSSNLFLKEATINNQDDCFALALHCPSCTLAVFDPSVSECRIGKIQQAFPGEVLKPLLPTAIVSLRKKYHLMMIGGTGGYTDVDVIDLSDQPTTCTKPTDFPKGVLYNQGTSTGGAPTICTGNPDNPCYIYQDGQWVQTAYKLLDSGLYVNRFSPVELDAYTWLVSGGQINSGSGEDMMLEVHPSTGTVVPFETALPTVLQRHTLLRLNNTHLFLLNGIPQSTNVWMYKIGSLTWDPMPAVNVLRHNAVAGVAVRSNGRVEVVVTSGSDGSIPFYTATQIFDTETLAWRTGPSFPVEVNLAVSVPYGSTFLAAGGLFLPSDSSSDKIYKYHPDNEAWIELPQKLPRASNAFASFLVPAEYC